MSPLQIIAHRGDPETRPENTAAAFVAALEAGAGIVELDVRLTRDRRVVVIHDATVERTTDGHGRVADLTLAELRGLSAGYPDRFGARFAGERVPTLAEALGLLRGRARVVIEIKDGDLHGAAEDGLEALSLAEVHRAGMRDDVALVSFDTAVLRRCRALDARVPRGHVFNDVPLAAALALAVEVDASFVLPEKRMLTAELCRRARAAGMHVATWLVDDPAELPGLRDYELFGVGTNRPAALVEALTGA